MYPPLHLVLDKVTQLKILLFRNKLLPHFHTSINKKECTFLHNDTPPTIIKE